LDADAISFSYRSAKKLAINETPIITVTGKAQFDIGHAPKDQSNRRKNLPVYAAWEIRPVLQRLSEFRRDPRFSQIPLAAP
jgi:hypothetical protein